MMPSCPRCPNSSLATSSTHGVWVMYCGRCWGMWVDDASVRRIAQAAISDASAVHSEALPCAICRTSMTAWHVRGIVVDRCDAHGVWFDRTELDHLVAAAQQPAPAQGGLGGDAILAGGVAIAGGVVLATGASIAADSADVERRAAAIDGSGALDLAGASVDVVDVALPLADVAGELASGTADAADSALEAGSDLVGSAAEVVAESAGGIAEALGEAVAAVFSIFS